MPSTFGLFTADHPGNDKSLPGYRGLTRFMRQHQGHLAEYFRLKQGELPSYSTIRRMLNKIDCNAVVQ